MSELVAAAESLKKQCGDHAGTEMVPMRVAFVRAVLAENELHRRWHRKPTHGPCCTCQSCGLDYDSCRCSLDDVAEELDQFIARARTLALNDGRTYDAAWCADAAKLINDLARA